MLSRRPSQSGADGRTVGGASTTDMTGSLWDPAWAGPGPQRRRALGSVSGGRWSSEGRFRQRDSLVLGLCQVTSFSHSRDFIPLMRSSELIHRPWGWEGTPTQCRWRRAEGQQVMPRAGWEPETVAVGGMGQSRWAAGRRSGGSSVPGAIRGHRTANSQGLGA